MNYSDQIPSFMMSPPSFSTDAIEVRLQFPMTNEAFEPHSPEDHPPAFKRTRISDSNHSNGPSRMNQHHQNPSSGNKGTSHIFFKTRICAKFRVGACRNGENCNFAHGVEDMRQPPPNWQELVGVHGEDRPSLSWEDEMIVTSMKLCRQFCLGKRCNYGDKCSFLHEYPSKFRDDSGRMRESTAISVGINGSPKPYGGDGGNNSDANRAVNNVSRGNVKSTFWKTKLCIKFETTGLCPFGDDCHFAHGQTELQGGHIESETFGPIPSSIKATIATVPRTTSVSANDAPPANEEKGNKCLLKWKGPKKINRIYGDWLDDLPLVHNLPSRVET